MLKVEVARPVGQDPSLQDPALAKRARGEEEKEKEEEEDTAPTATPVIVLDLARDALRAAEGGVPRFSHRRSPRTYTQHQLFALLAVKRFLGWDFRAVASLAARSPSLRTALGMERAPHYSTLCYAEGRLLRDGRAGALLEEVVGLARLRVSRAAAAEEDEKEAAE